MSADDDPYIIVETSVISEVTVVRIYDETLPHIQESHPEFGNFIPSLEHAIKETISNPTEIRRTDADVSVESFRFCSSNHTYGNNSLVVPVKVVEGTSARLSTAYFTDAPKGKEVWRASDE